MRACVCVCVCVCVFVLSGAQGDPGQPYHAANICICIHIYIISGAQGDPGQPAPRRLPHPGGPAAPLPPRRVRSSDWQAIKSLADDLPPQPLGQRSSRCPRLAPDEDTRITTLVGLWTLSMARAASEWDRYQPSIGSNRHAARVPSTSTRGGGSDCQISIGLRHHCSMWLPSEHRIARQRCGHTS